MRISFAIIPLLILPTPERQHYISVSFGLFPIVSETFYIYLSSSFMSRHWFLFALSSSFSVLSSLLSLTHWSLSVIWPYLSPFFFYLGVILGCLSLVYPFTIMFLPYLVRFLCYAIQHTLVIIMHHPYYFASLISPPSSPFSFTHLESGGWSRFICRLLLPSFEGSPVFFTVCHAFRQALGDVWNFWYG